MTTDAEQILTVSQLTREIREVLESRLGSVWVEGEVSNHRLQSSGHQYFTLKDAGAQLSCVMFRGAASRGGVKIADGVQVQVFGEISVYEPRGAYQLVVRQVQLKGVGSLQARFEALKRRLYEEGLFDEEHKRPIPKLPRVVALVAVYEALRSRRPHRPPLSHTQAVRLIAHDMPGHFDPALVTAFASVASRFDQIHQGL